MNNTGAIILAAGKGKRMNSKGINKVTLPLGNKPMILHAVELLQHIQLSPIVVVVGFAKDSVMEVLKNKVLFAEQKKRLGTAHATQCGLDKLPERVENVLVIQGDDSAFYTEEIFKNLITKHVETGASLTFLTINVDNPFGLGRVVRNEEGRVVEIVEEKDATEKQRKITEINPACYVFKTSFLRQYLRKIEKSSVTGEYYLTHLIDMAIANNELLETLQGNKIPWRGVNTPEELEEANRLYKTARQE